MNITNKDPFSAPSPPAEAGLSKSFYAITIFILGIFIFLAFKYVPSRQYKEFIGQGASMEPTFFDGDTLLVDPKDQPFPGDVIVFSCKSCEGVKSEEIMTKRLYEIDQNGCYWILGDNRENSYDSKDYGWLCEDDIELYGVVADIKKTQ